jgi:hypothetical protein
MLVLREDECVRVRTDPGAHVAEHCARHLTTCDPHVRGQYVVAARNDRVGQTDLAIELERASLHGDGPGGCPWRRRLVDDSHRDPQSCQPERHHQTGRPGAHDQHLRAWL